ncbi:hypothetical protein KVR01_000324 [Diaporthe batatas]|uniref:uncharacterized protein n=1 Tax=Diaporthe batatas TaxID=748121 RepID=UPI001D03906E|nr:uncharacterized protein KVR01_000324 [Diaporthe batatas]KAG8169579.1 hypothetical protein KVR01_000324 [Diaporthe batatas]
MFGRSEPKFALLSSSSDEEAYGSPDVVDAHKTVLRDVARRSHDSRLWIATTILFASLSAIMGWNQLTSMIRRSYETGFMTEHGNKHRHAMPQMQLLTSSLDSAVPHIRIKQQQFTGARLKGYDALLFDHQDAKTADGNLIRTVDKNGQSMMS